MSLVLVDSPYLDLPFASTIPANGINPLSIGTPVEVLILVLSI